MLNQEQIEALAINYSLIEGNIAVARLADTATGRPVYTVRASGLQNFTGTRTSYSAKAAMKNVIRMRGWLAKGSN